MTFGVHREIGKKLQPDIKIPQWKFTMLERSCQRAVVPKLHNVISDLSQLLRGIIRQRGIVCSFARELVELMMAFVEE